MLMMLPWFWASGRPPANLEKSGFALVHARCEKVGSMMRWPEGPRSHAAAPDPHASAASADPPPRTWVSMMLTLGRVKGNMGSEACVKNFISNTVFAAISAFCSVFGSAGKGC